MVCAVDGLTVATAQGYRSRDLASIEAAVKKLAETGVRVFVCIAFEVDLVQILLLSKKYGISGRGHVWVTGRCPPTYHVAQQGNHVLVASVQGE